MAWGDTGWLRRFDFMRLRKQSYQLTFSSPAGQRVLMDFARFCRANETCVIPGDHDRTLVLEGRREVWLRLQNHLGFTAEQLMSIYDGTGSAIQQEQ